MTLSDLQDAGSYLFILKRLHIIIRNDFDTALAHLRKNFFKYFDSMLSLIFFLVVTLVAIGDAEKENVTISDRHEGQKFVENGILSTTLKLVKTFYSVSPLQNVIFSPLNIYSAVGLCHFAASGTTRKEIAHFLDLPKDEDTILDTYDGLKKTIKSVQNLHDSTISFANGIFVQRLTHLRDIFLQHIKNIYESEIVYVDFENEKSAATDYINTWITEKTKNRIPQLLKEPLPLSTKILIASTLYFSAKWAHPFPEHLTHTDKFDNKIDVKMMQNKKKISYYRNENKAFEAIALPYEGAEFFMHILLPYSNQTLENLTETLSTNDLRALFGETSNSDSTTMVDFKVPYLKFKRSKSIADEFKKLGVKKLFENADLSNMMSSADLRITEITHSSEIESDENGTVASAASILQFESYSGFITLEEPVQFYVNRPFMFFITHNKTLTPILAGVVYNPLE